MPWKVSAEPLKPAAAIRWFKKRVPLTKAVWAALETAAKEKAFTVAGVAQLDLVAETMAAIATALEKGTTLEQFKAAIGPKLTKAWGGEKPYRLETIFRTNIQKAYSAGRERQMREPAVLKVRPFHMLDSVLDAGTTDTCRSLNGLILPADDERWKFLTPPLHHGCRTGKRALTREQAEARGGVSEDVPDVDVAEGFGAPPDESAWAPNPSKYPAELWQAYEDKSQ